jgi:isoleucyl-tRNA synthetase
MALEPSSKNTKNIKSAKAPSFIDGEFNLPQTEEKVLKFWDEQHIFEQSLVKKPGAKTFIFYEGPPYANGKPAIHHVIARIAKDVVLRYKTMQGFRVPRRAGWDTHGLPVEMAAEKALGLKSKRDIEQYGVKLFNEKAKEQVWIYKDEWERMTRRIGYWLDLKNAYVTYEPEYIESIWWTLSQIAKRKLLYKGHKVVPWCTRCGTSLSSHELAQGYKEVTDNSAYIKFQLKPGQKFGPSYTTKSSAYILSWTTTPWTLPGNVALAVGEKIPYTALRVKGEKELYILATALIKSVFKNQEELQIVHDDIKGKDLVGLEYVPLFDIPSLRSPLSYKIYPANFVTTTDGTGVVHTAVMYGEDDYVLGKKLGLPESHTVDEEGKFTKEVSGFGGEYVKKKDTEEKIFTNLQAHGNLLRVQAYVHEYPHCWRCGTSILYYARTSWFIAMSKLRAGLLKNNKTVNWTPAHVKNGRFGEWLREAKDWNLSRERYWGAPLPIWECEQCDHTEIVGSLERLDHLAGGAKNNYWAIRHGEAENITLDVIDSGDHDFHLTEKGRKQVASAAKLLRSKKIDLIFSSDLPRTHETSEIIAKATGAPVRVDKRLREIDLGSWSGRPGADYRNVFPHGEDKLTQRVEPNAESLTDVRARVWGFLQETERDFKGKNILIVSHEDTIWMLSQIANNWNDAATIAKKEGASHAHWGKFIKPAMIVTLPLKIVPRDDTGTVDLHRPFVDDILLPCPKCAASMRRVPEVADVWYDSGAMPYAQAHYPFADGGARADAGSAEKINTKTLSGLAYPADFIAEGMDQTRGWFYTMMAIATALGYKAPYKNVVALGLINDKFGQKMSKSKGNVVEPFAVIDKYGVDALRWYMFTGSPLGEPKNFDELEIAKSFRRMHLIIYNSFLFWKTYADHAAKLSAVVPKNILDQWILARLNEVVASATQKLNNYEIREAALELEVFVDDLSRWYIRRSRRRLQKSGNIADYKAASAMLGHVLLSLVKLMAPFTPFFSESLYGALSSTKASVHLDEWPKADSKKINKKLVASMAAARNFAALGLAKRAEAGIKVRQPLASMTINIKLGVALDAVLAEEMNVKKIIVAAKQKDVVLDTTITEALREEGLLRDLVRMFQELRQKAQLSPKDVIVAMMQLPAAAQGVVQKNEVAFKKDVGAKEITYRRLEKFQAEEVTKLEGQDIWIALRTLD